MFQIHFFFVLFFVLSCKFCTLFSSMYFFSLLVLPCASLFDSIRYHLLLYVIHYLSFVSVFRSEDNLIFSKHNNLWTTLFLRSLSKELFVPQVQQTVHHRFFFRRRGGEQGGEGGTNWTLLSQLGSQTKHLQDLRSRYSLDYTLDASN